MTREEWDTKWMEIYAALVSVGHEPSRARAETERRMERTFGKRPAGKDAGPPLWLKVLAPLAGVPMFTKIWEWLNGKKTLIGAIITLLSVIASQLAIVLPVLGVDAVLVGKILGIATAVVGVAHKIYKFLYKEEHP